MLRKKSQLSSYALLWLHGNHKQASTDYLSIIDIRWFINSIIFYFLMTPQLNMVDEYALLASQTITYTNLCAKIHCNSFFKYKITSYMYYRHFVDFFEWVILPINLATVKYWTISGFMTCLVAWKENEYILLSENVTMSDSCKIIFQKYIWWICKNLHHSFSKAIKAFFVMVHHVLLINRSNSAERETYFL